ncbi:GAF domain-containing protein [Phormidium sp. CCY1219]|uniref:GAF domain-containing protein n=1 Tax=Phormidium sp. CCY1219 TaxID=2886104 RepID=UPI002D1F5D87|nr:GAF domain-containing protein [Phormidium sp. CCY1219]MEB3827906.1 GAF domain-containing protein [Phormidium sp. CCY1219]
MNNQQPATLKADILIVDDTPDNLRLLSNMLASQGYQVRKAINGQLALKAAQMAPPDLILLDINMPEMNGYEVCQQLKSQPETCDIPVIFLSALSEVEDKVKAFEIGGSDYITKPFQVAEIFARVKNQLELRFLHDRLKQQSQELQAQNTRLQSEVRERTRAESEIRFLLSTTSAIAESADFPSALKIILRSCCETIQWDFAEAWVPNEEGTHLKYSGACYARDASFTPFKSQITKRTFAPNEGLPGRVWVSKQPEWLSDLSTLEASIFHRTAIANSVQLKTGFGVPITKDNNLLAVLVFFTQTHTPFDDRVLKLVSVVATQLGELIQRKQAEESLRQSEQRFRAIFKNAAIGIAQVWPNGGFIQVNPGFCQIVGYSESELLQQTFMDITHPDDLENNLAPRCEIGGDDSAFSLEKRFIHKTGRWVWTNVTVSLVRDEAGDISYAIAAIEDITPRKQAEEAQHRKLLSERLVGGMLDRIRRSLNLDEVLSTAVTEVRQFLSTDRTIIYQFDPQDWSGKVVMESVAPEWMPIWGEQIHDPCFSGKYVSLYREGRTRAIGDIHHSTLNQCHVDLLSKYQVKANLVVPILQGDNLWGLLIAHHCRDVREWHELEVESLRQLGVQLAIAIKQSTLYEQVQNELRDRKQAEAALRRSETREREKAEELAQTLKQLQNTQAQLVHSEKMASLGQLVAGIAHEINNPVNFIYGNLSPAADYIADLLGLIELYNQHYPEPPPEIVSELDTIELEYLMEDLPKLLNSMKMGSIRIKEIVQSLRTFSRLDEAEMKAVDLHENIDSTLEILFHRLQYNAHCPPIQVIKNYGKLPQVQCYPGQLNQVFMNLLSNAIDALEEKVSGDSSFVTGHLSSVTTGSNDQGQMTNDQGQLTIAITTELTPENRVKISIADSGVGMKPEAIAKIFDPFYTTKPVGKGTGLGLSISYQIIEKHQGQLTCVSQTTQGTEFTIEIPLQQG